jgi:hypothetical protein
MRNSSGRTSVCDGAVRLASAPLPPTPPLPLRVLQGASCSTGPAPMSGGDALALVVGAPCSRVLMLQYAATSLAMSSSRPYNF